MTVQQYIRHRFSNIGEITDVGIADFMIDFGISDTTLTDEVKKQTAASIDKFVKDEIMHPQSVSESGFSMSWSAESLKSYRVMMLGKYGITPNNETSALIGLNRIIDRTDIW